MVGEPFPFGTPPAYPYLSREQRAERLLHRFRWRQADRDDHAETCHGRTLQPNPCHVLRGIDRELSRRWAELEALGVTPGDLYATERAAEWILAVVERGSPPPAFLARLEDHHRWMRRRGGAPLPAQRARDAALVGSLGRARSRAAVVEGPGRLVSGLTGRYHPDPDIDAEIRRDALAGERFDLAAGYPARWWVCPSCRASHRRGWFLVEGQHRCLRCGYVGDGGTMHTNRPSS